MICPDCQTELKSQGHNCRRELKANKMAWEKRIELIKDEIKKLEINPR